MTLVLLSRLIRLYIFSHFSVPWRTLRVNSTYYAAVSAKFLICYEWFPLIKSLVSVSLFGLCFPVCSAPAVFLPLLQLHPSYIIYLISIKLQLGVIHPQFLVCQQFVITLSIFFPVGLPQILPTFPASFHYS